jgi:hypothetical protein
LKKRLLTSIVTAEPTDFKTKSGYPYQLTRDTGTIFDHIRAAPSRNLFSQFNCFNGPARTGNPLVLNTCAPALCSPLKGVIPFPSPGICGVSRRVEPQTQPHLGKVAGRRSERPEQERRRSLPKFGYPLTKKLATLLLDLHSHSKTCS